MATTSPLQPVDPATYHLAEQEKEKPWIVRKIVQSMTGRIVVAVGQTLAATGQTVICLSPWGDSSPLVLPCIRFRDVMIHTVIAATGGAAIVASPLMDSAGAVVVDSFGSTIAVEVGNVVAHEAGGKVADYLLIDKPANLLIPTHSRKLETTDVKKILITLGFKHIITDASLGFFRAPSRSGQESSLFSSIKDYLSIEKGWFNPYLFASCRRPLIPRSMVPDVVFCHGPWLKGDYSIGSTLLRESETVVALVADPGLPLEDDDPSLIKKALASLNFRQAAPAEESLTPEAAAKYEGRPEPAPTMADKVSKMFNFGHKREKSKEPSTSELAAVVGSQATTPPADPSHTPPPHPPPGWIPPTPPAASSDPAKASLAPAEEASTGSTTMIDRLTDQINAWRGKSGQSAPDTTTDAPSIPFMPPNRRMILLLLAISPHRVGVWTSSARPGESVMNYTLFNGCPTLVIPIKPGSPLIAWHAVTLKTLQNLKDGVDGQAFRDTVDDLFNYTELCIDHDRIELPPNYAQESDLHGTEEENRRKAIRTGIELVLAGAVRSGLSKSSKVKAVDAERAGLVWFRIP